MQIVEAVRVILGVKRADSPNLRRIRLPNIRAAVGVHEVVRAVDLHDLGIHPTERGVDLYSIPDFESAEPRSIAALDGGLRCRRRGGRALSTRSSRCRWTLGTRSRYLAAMWIRLCLSRRLRMALRRDQIDAELLAQSLTALERLAIFVEF